VSAPPPGSTGAFLAFVRAGFRRYATYRQATAAAAFTNTVFGFLKCYLLLAVLGGRTAASGYDARQLATFVWVGQGVLGIVLLWGWTEVAERIRTGDITTDLLRPVDPLWAFLAGDLGRAGHAALTRLLVPVAVGALFFPLYLPTRPATGPLFLLSVVLGTVVSYLVRYLVNLTAFWLLDVRGVVAAWMIAGNTFTGLTVPIPFFPDWAQALLWATPFPALFQAPLDVLVERGPATHQALLVAGQAGWVLVLVGVARVVQRRAVRKLVVQGG
jgi:ABC-2 type transport system permease protein